MNFYEKFPSATREVHIDLNLYRPELCIPKTGDKVFVRKS